MNVTSEIIRHELIGTQAKVAKSTHSGYVGMSGRIVDETRNTFTVMQEGKKRIVIKDSSVFHFSFPDGTVVEIDGKLLTGRPEDRLKKTIKRLW